MAELAMAQPSLHQEQVETGSEYTFSSSSFRKKKKKKKLRNKKIITAEEAKSRKCPPRSRSASALETATSASVPPPPPPAPAPTPVVVAAPASPIQNKKSRKTKSRGEQELDRELELSNHSREIRKPWETDIRKKNKTEYGDSLLRDGPCSADRIHSSSAASHHERFRRARSLSTSRHRSVSRHRSQSRHRRSSLQLISDWYTSDSEVEEFYEEPQLEKPSSFDDDEDITYEKYRQFLASTKSNDEDDTLSRQSVLSLKQKVGAAPALDFAYRYSAAADELLNGDNYDDSCSNNQLESKSNTEETTNLTEPEDLSIILQNEILGEVANDENDDNSTGENSPPIFLGGVVSDNDARSVHKDSESRRCDQESSSVFRKKSLTPPQSPISSPHPPYLTDSESPLKQPPTPTSVTSEELSLPSFPQPPQEEQDWHASEAPASPCLSRGSVSFHEEGTSRSFERESESTAAPASPCVSRGSVSFHEEMNRSFERESESTTAPVSPCLSRGSRSFHEKMNRSFERESESTTAPASPCLSRGSRSFHEEEMNCPQIPQQTRQDNLSHDQSQPHRRSSRTQEESDPDIFSPRPPSREPSPECEKKPKQPVIEENDERDSWRLKDSVVIQSGKGNGFCDQNHVEPVSRCPEERPKSPLVVKKTEPIQKVVEESYGHPSDESDYQPTPRKAMARGRPTVQDVEKIEPTQDTVTENDFDEVFSTEDDDSISEIGDEESVQDMEDDQNYPQEDRMLLNMLYDIHMG